MAEYKMKRHRLILACALFGTIAVFSFISFFLYKNNLLIISGLGSILASCLFLMILKIKIITTDKTIKKVTFSGDQEVSWVTIYSINTYRIISSGSYSTAIKWAIEPKYRNRIIGVKGMFEKEQKNGAIDVSDYYDGYIALLKEIKEKAVNAEIDQTTEQIITGKQDD